MSNDAKPEPSTPPPANSGGKSPASDTDLGDLALSFVPTWAKGEPGKNPYAEQQGSRERGPRGSDRGRPGGGGGRPGQSRDQRSRPGRPVDPRSRDKGRGAPGRGQPERGRGRQDDRRDRPSRPAPPREAQWLEISFMPDRDTLNRVAIDLRRSNRAYRLNALAHQFLAKPAHHAVKIEVKPKGDVVLYQCKTTRAVFVDKGAALAHIKKHCMPNYYEVEEVQSDPPTGNFTLVARCGLSGVLLGPPNHHSYNEKVMELHRERFAHMSLIDYRGRIETVRDPEVIEQWKQEQCKRVVYREKTDGEPGPEMDRATAEASFLEQRLPNLLLEGKRFVAPASVLLDVGDATLRSVLRGAWSQESQRPYTLLRALRPALRHMGMAFFRANGKAVFLTAVQPHPLSPGQTVETIGEVLADLHAHPGCRRAEMVKRLRPDKDPASPEVAEVLNPLRWLVEKGHVIEFYDGTLAVPGGSRPASGKRS